MKYIHLYIQTFTYFYFKVLFITDLDTIPTLMFLTAPSQMWYRVGIVQSHFQMYQHWGRHKKQRLAENSDESVTSSIFPTTLQDRYVNFDKFFVCIRFKWSRVLKLILTSLLLFFTSDVYFICFDRYRSGQLLSDPDVSVVVHILETRQNFTKI